jgi:glyoxylase-like metal-dependent hydrolase (beta-lactamase superfamily II)
VSSSLSIDVFNSGYKPIPGGPGWDDSTAATWPASTSTLISGERDAVLVDTFLTIDQGAELADRVAAAGKHLTHIYVTHGHGDHFFGINALKRRFPGVKAVATASVVDRMPSQFEPAMMDDVFRRAFPGQIPDDPGIAERLEGRPGTPTRPARRACTCPRSG